MSEVSNKSIIQTRSQKSQKSISWQDLQSTTSANTSSSSTSTSTTSTIKTTSMSISLSPIAKTSPATKNPIWHLEDENIQPSSQSSTMQEFITEQMQSLKDHFNDTLNSHKEDIIKQLKDENTILRAEIEDLKEELQEKSSLITDLEKDVVDVQQYIRRNNIEICGIPDNIPDNELEEKVIDIATALDVKINKNDIEACHRLKDRKNNTGPKRTIVRFTNRKWCDRLHKNKRKIREGKVSTKFKSLGLDHKKVYINNNLCPYNKFIWGKCKSLYDEELIDRFWIYNGFIYIADDITDIRGTKITHLDTLKKNYPGFDFDRRL